MYNFSRNSKSLQKQPNNDKKGNGKSEFLNITSDEQIVCDNQFSDNFNVNNPKKIMSVPTHISSILPRNNFNRTNFNQRGHKSDVSKIFRIIFLNFLLFYLFYLLP